MYYDLYKQIDDFWFIGTRVYLLFDWGMCVSKRREKSKWRRIRSKGKKRKKAYLWFGVYLQGTCNIINNIQPNQTKTKTKPNETKSSHKPTPLYLRYALTPILYG